MSYYSPRREVRLSAEQKGIQPSKGMVILAAILTFAGSIFIGRWVGMKLLESRTGIKSPAAVENYTAPRLGTLQSPSSAQNNVEPPRQNISAPLLVTPPPVIEPKTPVESAQAQTVPVQSPQAPKAQAEKPKPITLLPKEKPNQDQGTPSPSVSTYRIQTGLFSTIDHAKELTENLERHGYSASFDSVSRPDGSYYRVWVGPFDTRDQAETATQELTGNGYQAFVIEESGK